MKTQNDFEAPRILVAAGGDLAGDRRVTASQYGPPAAASIISRPDSHEVTERRSDRARDLPSLRFVLEADGWYRVSFYLGALP